MKAAAIVVGDDDDDDVKEVRQPSSAADGEVGKGRHAKAAAKRRDEKRVAEREEQLANASSMPNTAADFDRLVVTKPNSSVIWVNYMAHHGNSLTHSFCLFVCVCLPCFLTCIIDYRYLQTDWCLIVSATE